MDSTTRAPGFLGLGGLRLTGRGRIVVVVLALVLAAVAGLVGQSAVADAPAGPLEVRLHTVEPGETLWQFASGLATGTDDVRDVVAELRELNGLDSAALRAGQVVILPLR